MLGTLTQVAVAHPPTDSVVVESPLPGGLAAVVRFLFSTVPQWVQIAGAIVGIVAGLVVVILAWRNRAVIVAWFGGHSRGWKAGVAAIVLVVLGGVGFVGYRGWDFMQHDNGFCTGCHVMEQPFRRFTSSEHSTLSCHDCHRQGMTANVRQLYMWVAERPDEIGAHAPVPNRICAECHVRTDPDSTWQRIVATAGHAVHLNPSSPAMRDMECVTCHGQEVHRFKPATETCAQSGCHDALRIELGRMAAQTSLHCSTCHQFTATPRPIVAADTMPLPSDSARAALVPREAQCLECHAMRERLAEFKPEQEPHGAVCGTCHNPHTQTTPAGAFQTCATSNCHARADTVTPFHRGLQNHRLETCGACHSAHSWKTGGTDCRSCHTGITDPAVRTRPPRMGQGFAHGVLDAASAGGTRSDPVAGASTSTVHLTPAATVQRTSAVTVQLALASRLPSRQVEVALAAIAAGRGRWRRATAHAALTREPAPPRRDAGQPPRQIAPVPRQIAHATRQIAPVPRPTAQQTGDTAQFDHGRHESVTCTTCHTATDQHGGLKAAARQCTACHHGNTAVGRACERCHTPAEIAPSQPVAVQVALSVWNAPRTRTLAFAHERHARVACADCHGATLARAVERTCASCHADHHSAAQTCTSCHPPARTTHTADLHVTGCATSGCHVRESTPAITPVRNVCLACHQELADHKPGGDCAACHLSAWRTTRPDP